jgi:Reverse transcriptase (RNA-dependent DNA polymerase)
MMTPTQNKYFGTHFKAKHGKCQWNNVSLTIFNIVIDSVIRASKKEVKDEDNTTIIFYADNGFIGGYNHIAVQSTLNAFVRNFKSFGLRMNVDKTKTMTVVLGTKLVHKISEEAYHRELHMMA